MDKHTPFDENAREMLRIFSEGLSNVGKNNDVDAYSARRSRHERAVSSE